MAKPLLNSITRKISRKKYQTASRWRIKSFKDPVLEKIVLVFNRKAAIVNFIDFAILVSLA
jgi:hypothetical protein